MVVELSGRAIEVYDSLNPWMDCVFIVSVEDKAKAKEVLQKAYDDWHEENSEECYGVFFKERMDEAGISYELFYGEKGESEDE